MKYTLSLSDKADDTIYQEIVNPLILHNHKMAGPSNYRGLTVTIEDTEKAILGGLYGKTAYGWLFTELLMVPEPLRGRGIGTQLIQMAEQEALARGCHSAWLDTFEFQAKEFYEKFGYVVFGELPNFPDKFSRFFMKKSLVS